MGRAPIESYQFPGAPLVSVDYENDDVQEKSLESSAPSENLPSTETTDRDNKILSQIIHHQQRESHVRTLINLRQSKRADKMHSSDENMNLFQVGDSVLLMPENTRVKGRVVRKKLKSLFDQQIATISKVTYNNR